MKQPNEIQEHDAIDGGASRLSRKELDVLRPLAVKAVLVDNVPHAQVAQVFGICRATIYNWLKRYEKGGLEALKNKCAPGAEPVITKEIDEWMKDIVLNTSPEEHGFDSRLWTRGILVHLVLSKHGFKVDETTIGRHLRNMGLSCQKPDYRAMQQDDEKVERFCEQTFPSIVKMASNLDAEIVFLDEAGIGLRTRSGRTWGLVGETPKVHAVDGKAGYSMISSVDISGEMEYMVVDRTVNSEVFIEFLKHLLEEYEGTVILVMDQASYHKSKQTREFILSNRDRLKVFFIPAYSPELNPDEQVWNEIKERTIGKQPVKDKKDLGERLFATLRSLKENAKRIFSFFSLENTRYILEGFEELFNAEPAF